MAAPCTLNRSCSFPSGVTANLFFFFVSVPLPDLRFIRAATVEREKMIALLLACLFVGAAHGKCHHDTNAGCSDLESHVQCHDAQEALQSFAHLIHAHVPSSVLQVVVKHTPALKCVPFLCYGNGRWGECEQVELLRQCHHAGHLLDSYIGFVQDITNSSLPDTVVFRRPTFRCLPLPVSSSSPRAVSWAMSLALIWWMILCGKHL